MSFIRIFSWDNPATGTILAPVDFEAHSSLLKNRLHPQIQISNAYPTFMPSTWNAFRLQSWLRIKRGRTVLTSFVLSCNTDPSKVWLLTSAEDPSSIYSCSIGHILEHEFCHLGCWAVLWKISETTKILLKYATFEGGFFNFLRAKQIFKKVLKTF